MQLRIGEAVLTLLRMCIQCPCAYKESEQFFQSDSRAGTNLRCNPITKRFLGPSLYAQGRRDTQEVACPSGVLTADEEQSSVAAAKDK
jgi:hypothetical protein